VPTANPYETSIPGASVYGGAALLAKTAYQKSLARLNDQRGTRLYQAGFEGNINAETGVIDNVRASQTNKYGEFQQLNRNQAMQDESLRNQGIERGLGTGGGLAAQQRSNARYGYGMQDAAFGRSLTGDLAGFQDQQTGAAQDRDAALYQAELAAAQAAQQNGDWSPTNYTGMEQPNYGDNFPDQGDGTPDAGAPGGNKGNNKPGTMKKSNMKSTNPFGLNRRQAAANQDAATRRRIAASKPEPKKKQYLPGQAPTSLAVINNNKPKPKKKK